MIAIAGGPTVDRTSTGDPASVADEPRGDPAMVDSFTPRVSAATADSKVETSLDGRGRPTYRFGTRSMNLHHPSDPISPLPISQSSVSDAISRLQQEKPRIQKDSDRRKIRPSVAVSSPEDRSTAGVLSSDPGLPLTVAVSFPEDHSTAGNRHSITVSSSKDRSTAGVRADLPLDDPLDSDAPVAEAMTPLVAPALDGVNLEQVL
jgi:hypothetical protein